MHLDSTISPMVDSADLVMAVLGTVDLDIADSVTVDGTPTTLACGILTEITTNMAASTEAVMVVVSR